MTRAVATPADRLLRDVLVVQTYFVRTKPSDEPYYEIHVAVGERADRTVLVTRKPQLYADALAAEGIERRFDCRWTLRRDPKGARVQVLDSLTDVSSEQKGLPL